MLPLAWAVHKLDCDKDFDDVAEAVVAGSFAHIGRTKTKIENLHLLTVGAGIQTRSEFQW